MYGINKKLLWLILAIIIVAVLAGGYFYWKKYKAAKQNAQTPASLDFGIQTAPLENMPDVNPASKTNPYKSVKTNPFE